MLSLPLFLFLADGIGWLFAAKLPIGDSLQRGVFVKEIGIDLIVSLVRFVKYGF